MADTKNVLVIGAGVSGLSTGILLLRKGYGGAGCILSRGCANEVVELIETL